MNDMIQYAVHGTQKDRARRLKIKRSYTCARVVSFSKERSDSMLCGCVECANGVRDSSWEAKPAMAFAKGLQWKEVLLLASDHSEAAVS